MKLTTVASSLLVVLGIGFSGSMYLDHKASEEVREVFTEAEKESDLTLDFSSAKINHLSKTLTINDLSVDSTTDKFGPILIDSVEYSLLGEKSKEIPKDFFYKVNNAKVDISSIKYEKEDDKLLMEYLSGDDQFFSINHDGSYTVDENGKISFSSSYSGENFGKFKLDFNLDGVYDALNAAYINKVNGKKNPANLNISPDMVSLDGLSFSFTSDKFKGLVMNFAQQNDLSESDVVENLSEAISSSGVDEKNKSLVPHITVFKDAIVEDKNIFFKFSIGSEINQALVMQLFMSPELINAKSLKEILNYKLESKVVN